MLSDFDQMHEIARHLIHSTETLSTALSVVDSMVEEHESGRSNVGGGTSSACIRELDFTMSIMKSLLHRSNALEKRMSNEIALVSSSSTAYTVTHGGVAT